MSVKHLHNREKFSSFKPLSVPLRGIRHSGDCKKPSAWDKVKIYSISIFEKKIIFMFSAKLCSLLYRGQIVSFQTHFFFTFLVIFRSANQKAGYNGSHASLTPSLQRKHELMLFLYRFSFEINWPGNWFYFISWLRV